LQKETEFFAKSSLKHLATPAERSQTNLLKTVFSKLLKKQFFKLATRKLMLGICTDYIVCC
jgi:hypothetical protein